MFAAIRNTALAAITAMLLLGAGQARADIVYSMFTKNGATSISWSAPGFITPPTTGQVSIPGVTSCSVVGFTCTNAPFLLFEAGSPPTIPDEIEIGVDFMGSDFGASFLPKDFGADGFYTNLDASFGGSLTVSGTVSTTASEPGAVTLLAVGLAGLGMVLRTRRV